MSSRSVFAASVMLRRLVALALLSAIPPAHADIVFDNGAPTITNARDIVLFRSADDFAVGASEIRAVRFWIATTSPIEQDPETNFSGSITYAIYRDEGGNIGTLIASDTVDGIVSTFSGLVIPGSGTNINTVSFDLVTPVLLAPGSYWLEFHEGATLDTSDGTGIGWVLADEASGNAKQGLAANGLPIFGVYQELAFQLIGTVPEPAAASSAVAAVGGLVLAAWRRARSA